MSLKEPSFIQKHVEKLVMALALIVSLAVLAYFLVLSPFNVDIRNQTVTPDEAVELVEREAQRLRRSFESDAIPEEKTQVPQWSGIFVERYVQHPDVESKLGIILSNTGLHPDIIQVVDTQDVQRELHLPGVPVVQDLQASSGHAVYAANGDTAYDKAIYQLIGDETPRDFRYVSVSGDIDLDTWTERLQDAPMDQQIPSRFWRDLIGIAGVFLQRETLDPVSGEWTDRTIIPTLPGQIAYGHPSIKPREFADEVIQDHLLLVRENQQVITRPPFVNTSGGLPWTAPGKPGFALSAEQQEQYTQIQKDINELNERIRLLSRQLGLDREVTDQSVQPTRDIEGEPVANERQPRRELNERQKQIRQQRMQQYESLVAERDSLMAQKNMLLGIENQEALNIDRNRLEQFGSPTDIRSLDGMPLMGPEELMPPRALDPSAPNNALRNNFQQGGVQDEPEEVEQPRKIINVWAHDLTVEPGKTYRYRLIVTLLNPLFRVTGISEKQMQENMDRFAIGPEPAELDASPWTEAVSIDPAYRYFLVGRSGTGTNLQARFSVWTIYDGLWRHTEFVERPGDPIGGVETIDTPLGPVNIDMSIGQILVDIMADRGTLSGALVATATNGEIIPVPAVDPASDPDLQRLKATAEMEAGLAQQ